MFFVVVVFFNYVKHLSVHIMYLLFIFWKEYNKIILLIVPLWYPMIDVCKESNQSFAN